MIFNAKIILNYKSLKKSLSMKNFHLKKIIVTGLILVCSGLISAVYSQKTSASSPQKGGVKLAYNYPEGKSFKYVTDTKIVQDMDVNGQSMLVNVGMYMACQVKAGGKQGENLKLEIKIDSMAQNVESPQGTAGGPIIDIKGKSFNMVISPAGKTVDLTEASSIVFTVEGSGESSLTQSFLNFFPALPKDGINQGDTWTSNDTIDTKTPTNTLWMPVKSDFRYDGIENINGTDCAKITAALSGTRRMSTQAQGMNIKTSGDYTGTQLLLFSIKEGILIKETVTTKLTGNIEIPDQNMAFPVVMTINSTNEIVK
jgi:hypothetical protein